jgi:hypothetical protein
MKYIFKANNSIFKLNNVVTSSKFFSPLSISIKDFVREKKSATEKRKSNRNFLLMKFNTKPLKFKYGLADGGGGGGGLANPCKAWVPPPSIV